MVILVTGGARSGKSSFAENLYRDKKDVVYIATSKIWDKEMEERIKLHRESRPFHWRTYEGYYSLTDALGEEKNYLLDCITLLSSNIMFDVTDGKDYIDYNLQKEVENRIFDELYSLIQAIEERRYNLVLVTNEVGYSLVPDNHIGRVFRDIQGRINQRIAALSHEVYLVCCGIPVKIK
ncbi:bifunctional adenosylcobinamide kinase/adenosylcobinamide-phosphate guanylyltransferase [Tepidimicrobium xylanilyticum]|uniref:Adenosylcobinamide kinase n=2 Tax=Tepidimicrobium xylanilyticum TaxID=1123352 RepID=A0A1H2TLI6_9FIRM|nr:bifunctional adenosylcobinamide kinase/adenosylcobinamide-phosphate guanylyltransferase [Tepidimicrobium xylanilyticum]GMG95913.1 adenosylcobinamide kinase/adenosylcobinamide phosphate guanyltransferase [Tepidimicrobium xylanilyticum]SDW44722.1 adenosylcobinamide kinase /adenosylcobinamide-phosphate guanylyltransferase [Tepidimicrobium xylanilyticum]